jgi:hypothetical protein
VSELIEVAESAGQKMNSVYLLLLSLFTASAVEYTIDHAIVTPLMSSPQFSPRAYKEPLTGATTSALETAIPVVVSPLPLLASLTLDPHPFSPLPQIFPLAEATVDTSTWYYTVKVSSTNPDSSYTITSIPFCNLLLPASSVSKVVKETIVMTPNLVGEPLSATLRVTNKKTSSKGSSLCGVVDSSVLKEKFISTLQTSFDIDLGDKADSIPLKVQVRLSHGLLM